MGTRDSAARPILFFVVPQHLEHGNKHVGFEKRRRLFYGYSSEAGLKFKLKMALNIGESFTRAHNHSSSIFSCSLLCSVLKILDCSFIFNLYQ